MNIDELNSYQKAMDTDELMSSRKIRQEVLSNDDIANAFDDITYNKGSGVLNMFESFMGYSRFQEGIQQYLRDYSWKNATAAEFLKELTGNDRALTQAFSTFLDQAGVPLVSVKLQCNQGGGKLELAQERFLPVGSQGSSNQSWDIPICVKYPSAGAKARQCVLMRSKNQSLELDKARSCPDWVYANADEGGYYRVVYELPVLARLAQNEEGLTVIERVGLLGDLAAISKGHMPLGHIMPLLKSFADDQNAEVVSKTAALVGNLDDHLVPESLKPSYRRYLSDLFKKRAEELGWQTRSEDAPGIRLLRPQLDELMANRAEDPEFVAEAKKDTEAWLADHKAVDQDMLAAVLESAAGHGDSTLFDQMHEAAKKEPDELVRFTILHALGQFRIPELERRSMAFVLGNEFDVRQSLFAALGGGPFTPGDRDVAYDFIKQNWDTLIAKLPSDTGAVLPIVAGRYCDQQHRVDAEHFFTGKATNYSGGPRNLAQVLESIRICEANKDANQASVVEFLSKY